MNLLNLIPARSLRKLAYTLTAFACFASLVEAQYLPLYSEDFDSLPLFKNVDEPVTFPEAFTHVPPSGWDDIGPPVPGTGNPNLGVEEWEGWSYANKQFWQLAAIQPTGGITPRDFFTLGKNTVAVADPDQWNDLGDPANKRIGGFFNTLVQTSEINVAPAIPPDIRLKLSFDSSWFGGDCCNDGAQFGNGQPPPGSDNQTAIVRLRLPGGGSVEILRWEAAPYIDANGNPFSQPGSNTVPNPFYKPIDPNERVYLDLEPTQSAILSAALAENPELLASGLFTGSGEDPPPEKISLEFGLGNAGDDGWWAVDNLEVFAVGTVLGDMDVNGFVEEADVAAFALGLLDGIEYRNTYYGEFPVTRGSADSVFDFDDIEWFVNILEGEGVATSVAEVVSLLTPVPEPNSLLLLLASLSLFGISRSRR